jgi:5-oxoprolinase (ATP-hydrolysing) subunit A
MINKIELNCDMGESLSAVFSGHDNELMKYVTAVNIACGYHAGDVHIMSKTIDNAIINEVKIGAHPGFDDKLNFGRINQNLLDTEIFDLIVYQVGALKAMVNSKNAILTHVKPHGALYNMSAKNQNIAAAVAKAVLAVDKELILYGLSGSLSILEAKKIGLKTKSEAFADRAYLADGSLCPRNIVGAVFETIEQVIDQVYELKNHNKVKTIDGEYIKLDVDTICIHGDNLMAIEFAKAAKIALGR